MSHPLDHGARRGPSEERGQRRDPAEGGDVSQDERFGWGADPPARRGYGRAIYGESGLGDVQRDDRLAQGGQTLAAPETYAPGRSTFGAGGGHAGRGPKGYQRSDARILEDVCERLRADDEVDASEIRVSVDGGQVTLAGSSATRRQRQQAEQIAAAVAGVVDVHNQVRVLKV